MKVARVLLIVILALYGFTLLLAYIFQDKLLFFPAAVEHNYKYALRDSDREVFFRTSDFKLINGILYHTPGNKSVVLYFHGNGGSLDSWQHISTEMFRPGADLLLIDYRGYGKSEGDFSEQGFYLDADAAYKFLLQNGYSPNQIIVYGRSIGTGVAMQLATMEKVRGLILESPYTSIGDLANEKMPYLLPKLLLQYKLNTLQRAPALKVPVLIIHGKSDQLIPFNHSQKIYDAVASDKKLLLIDGAGHNNIATFKEEQEGVSDFISNLTQ